MRGGERRGTKRGRKGWMVGVVVERKMSWKKIVRGFLQGREGGRNVMTHHNKEWDNGVGYMP